MNGNITMVDNGIGNPILVACAPKVPAAISIVASYVMIRETYLALRQKASHNDNNVRSSNACRPLLRIVLAMSVADIIYSLPFVVTTWAAPAYMDTPLLWGNVGNDATCTTEAFLLQLGMQSAPLFNFLQGFYSLLLVRYNWTSARLDALEPWIHACVWCYALAVSVFPLFFDLYNNNIVVCYIGSYPIGCKDSFTFGESDCERGDNAWLYAMAFVYFPLWPCILGSAICMVLIYWKVRNLEDRISRYAGSQSRLFVSQRGGLHAVNNSNTNSSNFSVFDAATENTQAISRDKSRAVAAQAYWYMASFLLVNILNLVNNYLFFAKNTYNELFDVFTYILAPLQGILNFFVFARKRPLMLSPEGRWLRRLCFCRPITGRVAASLREASSSKESSLGSPSDNETPEGLGENSDTRVRAEMTIPRPVLERT